MNCSDCYSGCSSIFSDKCVQYTGVDVPLLDIKKGDSLSYVEQALITFLTSVVDGSGVKITIDDELYCELISQYLPECSTITALDIFKALVQAACDLQEQIDTIEATYTIGCLEGVESTSGTHAIVQAVITQLCEAVEDIDNLRDEITTLTTDLETNYVAISDINSYITAYINSQPIGTKYYTRMVPYSILPYYGTLSNFDATGAGLGAWEQIYLCNGVNPGVPDLRGRHIVGTISGVPGSTLSPVVDPASDPTFNPNYALGDVAGANKITLTTSQIPAHSHDVNDPKHDHVLANNSTGSVELSAGQYLANQGDIASNLYTLTNSASEPNVGLTSSKPTGISIENTGGGAAHDNKTPSLAVHFIMYIPS